MQVFKNVVALTKYLFCRCPVVLGIKFYNTKTQYNALVTVEGVHNHFLMSASLLQELKINPDTIAEFYSYFEQGSLYN